MVPFMTVTRSKNLHIGSAQTFGARKPSRWLTRAKKAKEKEGQELRLYNNSANDGAHATGPQSLRSSLLPFVLAMAKDIIRCKNDLFNLCGSIPFYLVCFLVVSVCLSLTCKHSCYEGLGRPLRIMDHIIKISCSH